MDMVDMRDTGFTYKGEPVDPCGSLYDFSRYCFNQPHENKPFHVDWYETIADHNIKSGLIIAPRNSTKSTCWGRVAPLWLLGCNPDLRVVLVSRTSSLAQDNLRFIRLQVESNDRVREVFPYEEVNGRVFGLKASSPWGTEKLTIMNNRNDGVPSVYAVGLEGSISGIRADLIIVDDLIDINNVMTEGQREKVNDFWDSVILPTLNPDGRIFLVGTRYHAKDFYNRMLEDPMYKDNSFMFPALTNEKGETWYDEEDTPISYWPERWPVEKLLSMKERMGSLAFNSQYQCDPSGYAGTVFNPEDLMFYDPERDLLPIWGDLDFVMSVDPNVTENPESDNTAIVTAAVDRRRSQIFILDIYAKPLGFTNQVKKITEYGRRRQVSVGDLRFDSEIRISKIGVEAVAYQRSLQQTGYMLGLPVVEVQQGNKNKEVRIVGVQPHFENGRLRLPNPDKISLPWYDAFYKEYVSFPKGRRDDMLDAVEILVGMVSDSFAVSGIPWGPSDGGALNMSRSRSGRGLGFSGGFRG